MIAPTEQASRTRLSIGDRRVGQHAAEMLLGIGGTAVGVLLQALECRPVPLPHDDELALAHQVTDELLE